MYSLISQSLKAVFEWTAILGEKVAVRRLFQEDKKVSSKRPLLSSWLWRLRNEHVVGLARWPFSHFSHSASFSQACWWKRWTQASAGKTSEARTKIRLSSWWNRMSVTLLYHFLAPIAFIAKTRGKPSAQLMTSRMHHNLPNGVPLDLHRKAAPPKNREGKGNRLVRDHLWDPHTLPLLSRLERCRMSQSTILAVTIHLHSMRTTQYMHAVARMLQI